MNIEDCRKVFINWQFYQEALNKSFDYRRLKKSERALQPKNCVYFSD